MEYLEVQQARQMPGLRLVLTRNFLNPWGETAKAIFNLKRIPFVAVSQYSGEPNSALREWAGQTSAPAAIYDDEPPRLSWGPVLHLAERLEREPPLLPKDPQARAYVLGLCEELAGEDGLGWNRRLHSLAQVTDMPEGDRIPDEKMVRLRLKYALRTGSQAVDRAAGRMIEILGLMAKVADAKEAAGHRYLIEDQLTILDVMWAAFSIIMEPPPAPICEVSDELRRLYTASDPQLRAALTPALLAHRDFMFTHYMEPPRAQ
jgi:glutathione S-transferase